MISTGRTGDFQFTGFALSAHRNIHLAGLIGILHTIDVDTVLCGDYDADTKIFDSFQSALRFGTSKVIHPKQGEDYAFGGVNFDVLAPTAYGAEKGVSFLQENSRMSKAKEFLGDAFETVLAATVSALMSRV